MTPVTKTPFTTGSTPPHPHPEAQLPMCTLNIAQERYSLHTSSQLPFPPPAPHIITRLRTLLGPTATQVLQYFMCPSTGGSKLLSFTSCRVEWPISSCIWLIFTMELFKPTYLLKYDIPPEKSWVSTTQWIFTKCPLSKPPPEPATKKLMALRRNLRFHLKCSFSLKCNRYSDFYHHKLVCLF